MTVLFCSQCGKPLGEDNVCPSCGYRYMTGGDQPVPKNTVHGPQTEEQKDEKFVPSGAEVDVASAAIAPGEAKAADACPMCGAPHAFEDSCPGCGYRYMTGGDQPVPKGTVHGPQTEEESGEKFVPDETPDKTVDAAVESAKDKAADVCPMCGAAHGAEEVCAHCGFHYTSGGEQQLGVGGEAGLEPAVMFTPDGDPAFVPNAPPETKPEPDLGSDKKTGVCPTCGAVHGAEEVCPHCGFHYAGGGEQQLGVGGAAGLEPTVMFTPEGDPAFTPSAPMNAPQPQVAPGAAYYQPAPQAQKASGGSYFLENILGLIPLGLFALLSFALVALSPMGFSGANMRNIMINIMNALPLVVAVVLTMRARGLDLSLVMSMTLGAVLFALLGGALGTLAAILIALFYGAVNGALIVFLRMRSLPVTIITGGVIGAISMFWFMAQGGAPIQTGYAGQEISLVLSIALGLLALVGGFLLVLFTPLGKSKEQRTLNPKSDKLISFLTYPIAAVLAVLAGVLLVVRVGAATTALAGYNYYPIVLLIWAAVSCSKYFDNRFAPVLIGFAALVFWQLLSNGLVLLGVASYMSNIILTGYTLLIAAAAGFSNWAYKNKTRRRLLR